MVASTGGEDDGGVGADGRSSRSSSCSSNSSHGRSSSGSNSSNSSDDEGNIHGGDAVAYAPPLKAMAVGAEGLTAIDIHLQLADLRYQHKLTDVAVDDLLRVMGAAIPGMAGVTIAKHHTIVRDAIGGNLYRLFITCPGLGDCRQPVALVGGSAIQCSSCQHPPCPKPKGAPVFVQFDLAALLADALSTLHTWPTPHKHFHGQQDNELFDITDGAWYKAALEAELAAGEQFIHVVVGVDGVKPYKDASSSTTVNPLLFTILELPHGRRMPIRHPP